MRNRLLTLGLLCIADTVNSALFGGGTALLVGLTINIVAADLGTLWDQVAQHLQSRDAVLHNEDLSRAVGMAIAAVIAKVSKEEQFRDYQESLKRLANHATTDWAALLQSVEFEDEIGVEPLRETALAQLFTVKPSDFSQVKALTPKIWAKALNTLQKNEFDFVRDPQVMGEVVTALHQPVPASTAAGIKGRFCDGWSDIWSNYIRPLGRSTRNIAGATRNSTGADR